MVIDKGDYKDIGDAVGMPDATDKANVRKIIDDYDKRHEGAIAATRRAHRKYVKTLDDAVVDKKSGRRYSMEIPEELHEKLEAYIPTLFRSRRHFKWLRKNFKELFVEF